MRTRTQVWLGAALAALLLVGSGCSLVYSEKRRMRRSIFALQLAVNNKNWERANELFVQGAKYYPYTAEGEPTAVGWAKWRERIEGHKPTEFVIYVEGVREIEGEFIAQVKYQARRSDATSSQNYIWTGTMIWVKAEGSREWKCREMRDLSAVDSFSS